MTEKYTFTIPKQTLYHRLRAIGYGIILLIWLATEDNTVWLTALLGTGLGLLMIYLLLTHYAGGKTYPLRFWLPASFLLGGIGGLSAISGTIFLMVFKNTQHSHLVLDFSPELIIAFSERVFVWILAGFLLGGALGLGYIVVWREESEDDEIVVCDD
jgi:hypothetical protein